MPGCGLCGILSGVNTKHAGGAPPPLPFSSAPRLAPARRQALAALALLGAACGPLLGIDEVDEAVGAGGAAGLAAGQGGAPAQGSAGVGGTGGATGGTGGSKGGAGFGTGGAGGVVVGPQGFLRFANLRLPPLSGPLDARLDICVRPEGSTKWQGPLLGKLGTLAFEDVSGYGALPLGTYEAVAVSALLGDCDTVTAKLENGFLVVREGEYATLAVTGPADTPRLIPYEEGKPPAEVDRAALSINHAVPDVVVTVLFDNDQAPLELNFGAASPAEAAPGDWPIAAFLVDSIPHSLSADPSLPQNFYSAFVLPARLQETSPIALLVCENAPPRKGGGELGNVSCLRLALDPPPMPPVRQAR